MSAEEVADALYAGEPGDFVAARDAAVKELRAAGRREEAAQVKALARPTVAAAGVNRFVRTEGAGALWAAGDALAAAQAALLAGEGSPGALREAKAEHDAALEAALAVAGEGARETLRAASVDPAARELVAGGRLEKELAPGAGGDDPFGAGFGGSVTPVEGSRVRRGQGAVKPAARKRRADPAAKAKAAAEAEAEAAEKAQAAAKAQAAEKAAKARAAAAKKQRKALDRKLDTARARAARSAAAAAAARETFERAQAASTADAERVAALEAERAALD